MSDFKSLTGMKSAVAREKITPELTKAYVSAIGYTGAGLPLTYLTRLRAGEFTLLQDIKIDLSSVLHAEQEYTGTRALNPGTELVFQTELSQVFEKASSTASLLFLVFLTRASEKEAELGTPTWTTKTTMVVRKVKS
jgi:hypothetical protein